MLSKQQLSFVKSLHIKKFRQMYGKFLVEGDKLVHELLASDYKVDAIYALAGFKIRSNKLPCPIVLVTEEELKKLSTHENPNQILAIAEIKPTSQTLSDLDLSASLCIACDNLSDPGNAGAIIRIADWFGIQNVFFSLNSVDIYNPKVVSAAKGSMFRVNCVYTDLQTLFAMHSKMPVFGTFMDGENVYHANLPKAAFILLGNEANGISPTLASYISKRISIPAFGKAESLNVAVAAGIITSEFKRQGLL